MDGSGLSRYNRIQQCMLYAMLKKGCEMQDFMAALPHSRELNSTLKKRHLTPYVRAKTGTLSGVSTLCCYAIRPKCKKVFAIVAHNFRPSAIAVHQFIDSFVMETLGTP